MGGGGGGGGGVGVGVGVYLFVGVLGVCVCVCICLWGCWVGVSRYRFAVVGVSVGARTSAFVPLNCD